MEKLKKLYDVLIRDKYYTNSFEAFQIQFDDAEYQKKVYDVVSRDGLYTKPFENFVTSYVTVKKKDDSQLTTPEAVTESPSDLNQEQPISSDSLSEDPNSNTQVSEPGQFDDQFNANLADQQIEADDKGLAETKSVFEGEPVEQEIDDSDQTKDTYNNGKFFITGSQEKDTLLEEVFGKNSVTDFVGDIYRAGKSGFVQGNTADEGLELLYEGSDATDQEIRDFLKSQADLKANGQTDEMANFNNIYDNADNKFLGFLEGLAKNPSAIFQLTAETITQMINPASLGAAGTVIGTAAAGGAAVGSLGFGVGAAPVALGAAFNPITLRTAFGAAGAALETGLSFAQFLQKELDLAGLEMNQEGVSKVLNDPEAMSRIRLNSLGRGGIIGTIDALAAGAGGKLVSTAAKGGASIAKRKVITGLADMVGGGVGEAAAITATEGVGALDVREIGLETIGGLGSSPVTYAITKLRGKPPTYTIKGKTVSSNLMAEAVFDSNDEAFMGMNIDIQNDAELKAAYDKRKMRLIAGKDIKAKLKEAGVTDETTIEQLVDLELEKNKFIGNDTEAGKVKLKEIKEKIAALSGVKESTSKESASLKGVPQELLDLFGDTHTDSRLPYGKANIKNITKADAKGVATATYTNPETGSVDAIISSKDAKNFVGYVRVYENGKPTNNFTAKMESTKGVFKNMITAADATLPDGARVIETTTISEGGLRTFNNSKLDVEVDSDGKVVTRTTKYSDATQQSVEEKGQPAYNPFKTDDKAKADAEVKKIEKAYPGIEVKVKKQKGPPPPPPRPNTNDKPAKAKDEYTIDVELPVLIKNDKNAIQESSTKKVDAQESSTDSQPVGTGDVVSRVSPNEKGKKNANKNKSSEKVVNDKKEETIIQNEKTYDIVRDKSGDVVSINDKKGKPLKGKKLARAEKQILEDISVDDGKKSEFNPGMTEDNINEDIADNSDNVREIAEAIEQEEERSKDKKNELEQDQENEDNRTYRGTISEADFARYNDKNNLPKDKRSRIWKFISKPVKDELGRETNMGGEGFDNMIENIAEESGQTSEAVMEEYFNYILSEKEPKRNPRAILNALKDRFKAVTGVRPTKANVKAAAKKKVDSTQNKVAQEEAEVKSKEAEQVELQNEIERTILDKLTKLDFTKGFKEIRDYLKTLRDSDKISFRKMALIMDNIEKTSFDNKTSRENTVKYIKSVLAEASKKSEEKSLRKLAKTMRKNIKKLIGRMIAGKEDGSSISLQQQLLSLANIDPSVVPSKVFDVYKSILQQIGKATKALDKAEDVSVIAEKVQEVLKAISEQEETIPQLTQYFNDFKDKVLYKNGKINFNETLAQMINDGVITEEDAKLMKKYKKDINPRPDAIGKTAEQLAEEKQVLIEEINKISVDSDRTASLSDKSFPSVLSRTAAFEFNKLIKNISGLEGMSNTDLRLIIRTVDSLNQGYMPVSMLENLTFKLKANINTVKPANSFFNHSFLSASKLYARAASLFNKADDYALNAIRRNTLYGVDQLLNNFKSMDLYNALFKPMAKSQSSFSVANKQDANLREKAEKLLSKAFSRKTNDIVKSKYKQMIYRIQLEYDSNPELQDKTLRPVIDWLDASIKDLKKYTDPQAKRNLALLEDLRKEYAPEGNLDINQLYDSFLPAEKESIKILQDIDIKNQEKAQFAAERRGEGFVPRINYTHIAVRPKYDSVNQDPNADVIEDFQSASSVNRPSTKSKAAISRTGQSNPIYFDAFTSSARGSKFTNLDYYMTAGVKEGRYAIQALERKLNDLYPDGIPENSLMILNALKTSQKEVISNVLENDFTENSFSQEIISSIQKIGYRVMLAGLPRWTGEIIANMQFAIMHPKLFATGLSKANRLNTPESLAIIMQNLGSTMTTRVTGSGLNSSKIDTGLINTRENASDETRSPLSNKIMQIWRYTGKPWKDGVATIADTLISSPDKIMMQAFWKAEFLTKFKEATGNNPDYALIEANDEAYMRDNKEAFDAATDAADRWSNTVGSTDNPFMRSLRGANPKGVFDNIVANFNGFMLNFLKQEFISARQGTYEMIGKGDRSPAQGAQLLAAVTLRMTAYTFVIKMLNEALFEALDLQDDDDEQKEIDKQLATSLATTFTGLILGRNFGNISRTVSSFFVESLNQEYGQDLFRDTEEYNKYEDSIQYDVLGGASGGDQFLTSFLGAYTPMVKTGLFALEALGAKEKTETDARIRQERELTERLPIELLGMAGMVPLYKDVKALIRKDIYKNMRYKEKSYNKKELLELKKRNPNKYKNYVFKEAQKKYKLDVVIYRKYKSDKRRWRKDNPNKRRPTKPKVPRR